MSGVRAMIVRPGSPRAGTRADEEDDVPRRQIALLRGVNLGRHNRIPMQQLRAELAALGFGRVLTHLQSGNVVFSTDSPPADSAATIRSAIAERFGCDVPVLVRTREELAGVVATDPLSEVATDPSHYLVTFLSAAPDPGQLPDPAEFAPDVVRYGEREIFTWCPDGVRNARAPQSWWERRLGIAATSRNWTTTTKLLELAGD